MCFGQCVQYPCLAYSIWMLGLAVIAWLKGMRKLIWPENKQDGPAANHERPFLRLESRPNQDPVCICVFSPDPNGIRPSSHQPPACPSYITQSVIPQTNKLTLILIAELLLQCLSHGIRGVR